MRIGGRGTLTLDMEAAVKVACEELGLQRGDQALRRGCGGRERERGVSGVSGVGGAGAVGGGGNVVLLLARSVHPPVRKYMSPTSTQDSGSDALDLLNPTAAA